MVQSITEILFTKITLFDHVCVNTCTRYHIKCLCSDHETIIVHIDCFFCQFHENIAPRKFGATVHCTRYYNYMYVHLHECVQHVYTDYTCTCTVHVYNVGCLVIMVYGFTRFMKTHSTCCMRKIIPHVHMYMHCIQHITTLTNQSSTAIIQTIVKRLTFSYGCF